ncbi:MAG: hypothetical protein EOP85_01065 [Verrucomicrobiaceae bacterium]|nr:MAG: hypothetical protein EOP85_01065 [Verrucomicrobiaceae bacterium]
MKKPLSKAASWLVKRSHRMVGNDVLLGAYHRLDQSRSGRYALARLFSKYSWYQLLQAHGQRERGEDHEAFVTLMRCHRKTVNDARLHIKLSEIYRDNGENFAAHLHLKIPDLFKPGYNTVRRLAFETDHGLFVDGSASLARILEMPPERTMRYLNMLNRVSIHYPEHAAALDVLRAAQKAELRQAGTAVGIQLASTVETALSNRWPTLATELASHDRRALSPLTLQLLERLESDFQGLGPLLDAAWENETATALKAFRGDQSFVLGASPLEPGTRVVEFFIPSSFFSKPDKEKPTYETIRRTFTTILRYLHAREEVVIVPRLQLYWRQCMPKVPGASVVSYHTHSPAENPLHLHIQESPLAGRSSIDHAGFAGFASIATNHGLVTDFTASVPPEALRQNYEDLKNLYVAANVSKYQQPEENIPIQGDYVFVALQIPTDIVSRLAWINGLDLLDTVVAHYQGTGTQVVVKRHPFCGSKSVQKHLKTLEESGAIIRTKNSVHSLITDARRVFTVNSGVGLEALLQGKSVVVTGACDYAHAVTSARSVEELRDILKQDAPADQRKIEELLYYYVHRFTVTPVDEKTIQSRIAEWLALP